MDCLIIAAGEGSRLNGVDKPKPLVTIDDIPLIEYIIDSVIMAGINKVYVVVGCRNEEIESSIHQIALKKTIEVECIYNPDWKKGNGLSVLSAKDKIQSPFLLLMADHLFHRDMLIELLLKMPNEKETILAVDSHIVNNPLVDLEDVTRVYMESNEIIDIGKHIKTYNAFDTGIFLSSPYLFEALEKAQIKGNYSLSDGMQILRDQGLARVKVIKNACWIDIDTPEMLNKAKELIRNHSII